MTPSIELRLRQLQAGETPPLPPIVARDRERTRAGHDLATPARHVLIIGQSGSGKTRLARAIVADYLFDQPGHRAFELALGSIVPALLGGEQLSPLIRALGATAERLTPALLSIDDLDELGITDPLRLEVARQLLMALTRQPDLHLVTTAGSSSASALTHDPFVTRHFSVIRLADPTDADAAAMVAAHAASDQSTAATVVAEAVRLGRRFGNGRALPDSAIRLLQSATSRSVASGRTTVTRSDLYELVAETTGLPLQRVTGDEQSQLADLAIALNQRVVGQPAAVATIVGTLQRARLGLADPHRPRGSFLLLGPSGVGKTETAKVLSSVVFGSEAQLIRLDMNEFGDAHTAARLTGSPPGYVGYEAGGQLTNPVADRPYSLVLFDELEKAHPKLHDVLLAVLDDGRLTDAAGRLVDFSQTVLLATSNCATDAIVAAWTAGQDVHEPAFFDTVILPKLLEQFRPEFVNRFDGVLVYEPLTDESLLQIARLGLVQLADRLGERGISLAIPDELLMRWLAPLRNPLLGARPVRRMQRDRIETPIAQYLLAHPTARDFTVTGEEPWLA